MSAVFQRLLLFLGICLPVPLLAATGLSLPGIALAVAAGAILLVVRHFNTIQAERSATSHARVVAATVLPRIGVGPLTSRDASPRRDDARSTRSSSSTCSARGSCS